MLCGFVLASWGPIVFKMVSGFPVPPARAEDPAAMLVWSGVAFARVFGAALMGLGAVLLASTRASGRDRAIGVALCLSSTFAALVTAAQQRAIWSSRNGLILVAMFGLIALAAGIATLRDLSPEATRQPGRVG